eukprot:Sspe_Gene.12900::Locus_4421_Transcript_1_1_Confidence_1.000_Length_1309::g.12900::m.12900/K05864/PPID, CYPD; peptidyl-prolyl isomerase D
MADDTGTRCFFDITIGGEPAGRIVFGLYDREVPHTCANFAALCRGDTVPEGETTPLTYKGSCFHRVIPGFICQGGDITHGNGTGGRSIYGDRFDDEVFVRAHSGGRLLGMANSGPNTNCSQFYITVAPAPHLNGHSMVFGVVLEGMSTVRAIEQVGIERDDRPAVPVVIADCGVLGEGEPSGVERDDEDMWEDHPADNLPPLGSEAKVAAALAIRKVGNIAFKEGNYTRAIAKYTKSLHYLRDTTPSEDGNPSRGEVNEAK